MLINILNTHSKIIRVMFYLKRWQNEKVAQARKIWTKKKKTQEQVTLNRKKLKQAQNAFYHLVHKAKKEYWQNFLEGEEKILEPAKIWTKDKNKYQTTFRYTKAKANSITPVLIKLNNKIAIMI